MSIKIKIDSRALIPSRLREDIKKAVTKNTLELETEIKTSMSETPARGRTYRRSSIRKKGRSQKERAEFRRLGLKRRGGKFVVGAKFHRASAAGDPPAVDLGAYVNSFRSKILDFNRGRVSTAAAQALALEHGSDNMAARPHVEPARKKQEKKLIRDTEAIFKK